MNAKKEIRLSGTGGQGIILGGILLAEAAILDGKEVVQTQSYGPEARGGASRAEVIIDEKPILYPKVITPGYLLLMSQEAAGLYAKTIAEGGLIVMDSSTIREMPPVKAAVLQVPITKLAREEIGNELTANILAIAALSAIGDIVSKESLEEAVKDRLAKVADINIKALNLGWEWGKK
jgi:2-oxoglutarate ferredoxin oxidoreductase subunit gamma